MNVQFLKDLYTEGLSVSHEVALLMVYDAGFQVGFQQATAPKEEQEQITLYP